MTPDNRIKVKRDGPRGWHWIARENYDPSAHELFDEAPAQEAAAPVAKPPRKKGAR